MNPKSKADLPRGRAAIAALKLPILHDVTNQTPALNAAAQRRMLAPRPPAGALNHAVRPMPRRRNP